MGLERTHTEFLGQGEGLAIVGFSWLDLRELTPRRNVAKQVQGIHLIAAFLVLMGKRHQGRVIGRPVRSLIPHPPLEQSVERGFGHTAVLAAIVGTQFLRILELPLTGRMVHQRSKPDIVTLNQLTRLRNDTGRWHLAAQMQKMASALS